MITVVGVRFRNAGKTYFFDPCGIEVKRGDHVIVDTAKGKEYGEVMMPATEVPEEKVVLPLKEVIRVATPDDAKRVEKNKEKEKEALKICEKLVAKNNLEMKLINVEYSFDNSKILFYFTADGRVDFRELVKDLAASFKTRIELRQIGVRDETKLIGGLGVCGRELCCNTFLSDFAPVSIKMAKMQSLSLNPSKISGSCGRLMCCLKNEQETYEYLKKALPNKGDIVELPDGRSGHVDDVNIIRQLVKVIVEEGDEKELVEYPVAELKFKKKQRKGKGGKHDAKDSFEEMDGAMSAEEKEELKKLEQEK